MNSMNIKDIRIIQKLRRRSELHVAGTQTSVENWVEKISWTLQIKRVGFGYDWEDVEVIEEFEEDV